MPTEIYAVGKRCMGKGVTVTGPHHPDEAEARKQGLKIGGHKAVALVRATSKEDARAKAREHWWPR